MRNLSNKQFWRKWMILTPLIFIFGIIFSGIIGFIIGGLFQSFFNGALVSIISYSVMGAGAGASISFIQRKILKNEIKLPWSWILAGATGLFISEFVVGFLLWILGSDRDMSSSSQFLFISLMIYAIGGTIIGILQVNILEKKNLNARLWVIANSTAWGLAFLLTLISLNDQEGGALILFGMIILAGVVFSFITGYAMKKILESKALQ